MFDDNVINILRIYADILQNQNYKISEAISIQILNSANDKNIYLKL